MKRALIVSRNLIGDALWAGVAIREFFKQKKSEFDEIDLLTMQDHVTVIYKGLDVEWSNIFTSENEIARVYHKKYTLGAGDAGKYADENQCHIVEGFCHQLEVEPPNVGSLTNGMGTFKAWKPFYDSYSTLDSITLDLQDSSGVQAKGLILFSPFSASCSSRKGQVPNKMLLSEHWIPIIQFMRMLGPIRMLGAPDDKPDESWQLSEDEVMTGVPLDWLAAVMKQSKLIITIDNGMGHLAASQGAKHILFYPMCLGLHFILPWGANNTVPIQMEPSQVQPLQVISQVRRAAKFLGVI